MSPTEPHNKQATAVKLLRRLSHEIDRDEELVDVMPIEDVRTELEAFGVDRKTFHHNVRKMLHKAKLHQVGEAVREFFSEKKWIPELVGSPVTAADIPPQSESFTIPGGELTLSCLWRGETPKTPAFFDMTWAIDSSEDADFYCRFLRVDTDEMLNEILLGPEREDGCHLDFQHLGFNPFEIPWKIEIHTKIRT